MKRSRTPSALNLTLSLLVIVLVAILAAIFFTPSSTSTPNSTQSVVLGTGTFQKSSDIQGGGASSYSPQNPASVKPGDLEKLNL